MNIGAKHLVAAILALGTAVTLAPAPAEATPRDGLIQPMPYYRYYNHPYYRPYHRGHYGYRPRFDHHGYYGHSYRYHY